MIDKTALIDVVKGKLEGTDLFLVEVTVGQDNRIVVEIDSKGGYVSIDDCAELTRLIEGTFDRDKEDYELEVGSAGLTSPFKVLQQYEKNVGNDVEVLTQDGKKIKGRLEEVETESFSVMVERKVKPEGAKRPVIVEEKETYKYEEIKYTKYLIDIK